MRKCWGLGAWTVRWAGAEHTLLVVMSSMSCRLQYSMTLFWLYRREESGEQSLECRSAIPKFVKPVCTVMEVTVYFSFQQGTSHKYVHSKLHQMAMAKNLCKGKNIDTGININRLRTNLTGIWKKSRVVKRNLTEKKLEIFPGGLASSPWGLTDVSFNNIESEILNPWNVDSSAVLPHCHISISTTGNVLQLTI